MNELVSVIVPCYNYGHFLPETLESVRKQTFAKWECIVVDDGSTDCTREIAGRFEAVDKRFRYVYQENKGLSAARNTGIRLARGDLVQFLDADDLIEANKLLVHASYLYSNPHIDIVYGGMKYFASECELPPDLVGWKKDRCDGHQVSGKGAAVIPRLLQDNIMPVSAALVKKPLLEQCGGFDETLKSHEDWDIWLRCAFLGADFQYCSSDWAKTLIRVHGTSMSRNRITMHESNLHVRKKISALLMNATWGDENQRRIREVEVLLAVEKLKGGSYLSGGALFLKSCFTATGIRKIIELIKWRLLKST